MFRVARDLARRKQQYPEAFSLGEQIAEDRILFLSTEDRQWGPGIVDSYLREVSEDTVRLVLALAQRAERTMTVEALSTVGIACGVALDAPLRKYISSGAAYKYQAGIAKYRDDYERGRELADLTFYPEPEPWLKSAPLVSNGIMLYEDQIGLAGAFAHNAFSPKYSDPSVAQNGFYARMSELVRRYVSPEHEVELRGRESKAAARLAAYRKVSKAVEAEFRARGNYSVAEMKAETERRMADHGDSALGPSTGGPS